MSRQVKSGEVKAAQIMFVLILGLLWASEVYSQGTCQIVAGVQSSDTHSKKDWRLNIRHTPTNLNFSQAEYAATRAAALWNEATNSGYFNYRGSTGIVSLPDSYADCVAQGRLYHLVTFESNSVASLGRETKRCIDSNGLSHFSHIEIFNSTNSVDNNWGVDNLPAANAIFNTTLLMSSGTHSTLIIR